MTVLHAGQQKNPKFKLDLLHVVCVRETETVLYQMHLKLNLYLYSTLKKGYLTYLSVLVDNIFKT